MIRGTIIVCLFCGLALARDFPLSVEVLESHDLSTQEIRQYATLGTPARTRCEIVAWSLECTTTPATPSQTYDYSVRRGATTSNALVEGKTVLMSCSGNKCPLLEKGTYEGRWMDSTHTQIEIRTADLHGKEKRNRFVVSEEYSPVSNVTPQLKELDGAWKGAWRSTVVTAEGTAVMTITTQGTVVAAEISLTGSVLQRVKLTGEAAREGEGWKVTLKTQAGDLWAQGIFKGGAFLGDYTYAPASDHGNWGLTKN